MKALSAIIKANAKSHINKNISVIMFYNYKMEITDNIGNVWLMVFVNYLENNEFLWANSNVIIYFHSLIAMSNTQT